MFGIRTDWNQIRDDSQNLVYITTLERNYVKSKKDKTMSRRYVRRSKKNEDAEPPKNPYLLTAESPFESVAEAVITSFGKFAYDKQDELIDVTRLDDIIVFIASVVATKETPLDVNEIGYFIIDLNQMKTPAMTEHAKQFVYNKLRDVFETSGLINFKKQTFKEQIRNGLR